MDTDISLEQSMYLEEKVVKSRMLLDECENFESEKKTIWMINSTRDGGGVAEMLPNIVVALRNKGYQNRWLVLHTERI